MNEANIEKEDYKFFVDGFKEYSKNNQISFDIFKELCNSCKSIDKAVLNETLKEIKAGYDKKVGQSQINFKEDEYYNNVNLVFRDQNQKRNQDDEQMEKLFKSLAHGDNEYVYKKKLSDIITMYGLTIDLNSFFKPIGGQEEINFNEFCMLFKPEHATEELRKTFYSMLSPMNEPEENENLKAIHQANFPIKYYGH